uniref:Ion transport domain-containing protein n=1 Tax=Tetranychus urticae TaxID=32264 RepID=T1K5Y8_TETUR
MHRALVKCALDGVPFTFKDDIKSLQVFLFYSDHRFGYITASAVFVLHAIAIWEDDKPSTTHSYIINSFELICLSIILIRLFFLFLCSHFKSFCCDAKNVSQLLLISLTVADIVCHQSITGVFPARYSYCLRPFFIFLLPEQRQLRRIIRCVISTLPDQMNVLILYFLSLGMFSLIGLKLFSQRRLFDKESMAFDKYHESLYHLYVLVTTANNPSIMLPAYNHNRFFALFYVIFLLINWLLFMNIALAVIYNSYKLHLKDDVSALYSLKLSNLNKAFDVITSNGQHGMTREQFNHIIVDVIRYNPTFATVCSRHYLSVVWFLLQTNGLINRREFLKIAELPGIQVNIIYPVRSDELSIWISRVLAKYYDSSFSMMIRIIVQSVYYQYTSECILILNLIALAIDSSPDHVDIEYFVLLVHVIDNFAKLYTQGVIVYCKQFWNLYSLTATTVGIFMLALIVFGLVGEKQLTPYFDVILVLLALPIVKMIGRIERFHLIASTVRWLIPFIVNFGIILFAAIYFFAIIGMFLFSGLIEAIPEGCPLGSIDCCPANLEAKGVRYCSINFNTIQSSFLLLFDLLVVNDWHQFVRNYEIVTGTKWVRLYFVFFHLLCVIVALNCFTAFIIESFILEYTRNESNSPSGRLMNRIRNLAKNNCPNVRLACNPIVRLLGKHNDNEWVIFNIPENVTFHVEVTEASTVESSLIRVFQKELEDDDQFKKANELFNTKPDNDKKDTNKTGKQA